MYSFENQATGEVVARKVLAPKGWCGRNLGLLTRSSIDADEGLWINRCFGIHTIGMRFPIDVVFLDDAFRIVSIRRDVRPGCLAVAQANATHVVELRAGTCEEFDMLCGDRMRFVQSASGDGGQP
ncbi:MAG TPA: DUF192 domain-containing protein [Candidatus Dormibacteraeota bacterium]|nr:DUF192 domain-containing protein [Candidatus Dormibacteraeota bacterium]